MYGVGTNEGGATGFGNGGFEGDDFDAGLPSTYGGGGDPMVDSIESGNFGGNFGGDGGGNGGILSALKIISSQQDLNRERYDIATGLMTPYIDASGSALDQLMIEMGLAPGEGGTAYMETPAYQALMDERLGAVQQGMANTGSLYSGRRMQAAADVGGATQTQFYNNYMNLLERMSNPNAATNLAGMGLSQGIQMTGQEIGVQQAADQARADRKSDLIRAGAGLLTAFI